MKKLKRIKLSYSEKKGTTYTIEWSESEDGKMWERHIVASSEEPRPELKNAIDAMGVFLIRACEVQMTESEIPRRVNVTDISCTEKTGRWLNISGIVALHNNYVIRLNGPQMPLLPEDETFCGAYARLEEECFRYINGDRAQMKLFCQKEEGEDVQDFADG